MTRLPEYSKPILRTARWRALRLEALRRDGFKCVVCGSRRRLEVDHIEPVRNAPDRAFDLTNLQTLCAADHTRKTRIECGRPVLSPERQQWRDLLQPQQKPTEHERKSDA